jgi:hypothetical protein
LIWDKIKQLIESQATKLNIPVTISEQSDLSEEVKGLTVIFIDSESADIKVEDTRLLIGLPATKENYKAIKASINRYLPQLSIQYHQAQRDQFKQLVLSGIDRRKVDLRESIQQDEYTLQDLKRQLFDISRKWSLDKQILKLLEKPKLPIKRKILAEYANLRKLVPGHYQSVDFEDNHIKATTHKVVINHFGEDYEIGVLQIDLDLSRGEVKLHNQTNAVNGYHHPHVNEGGDICLGNILSGLQQLLGEFEIYGALELMHRFVHEYNETDSYQKIQYWNDPDYCEDDNEYENCREGGSYGRTCLDCGDTYCPYYELAYEQCSEEPDFTKCIRCDNRCQGGIDLLKDCHEENPLACMTCSFSHCPHYHKPEDCRNLNPDSCMNCNIEYCQYKGVANETAA